MIDVDKIVLDLRKHLKWYILLDFINVHRMYSNVCFSLDIRCNFPEYISETIVLLYLQNLKKLNPVKGNVGDLYIPSLNLRIEVKAFSSIGPSSFGTTEKWDILYFVDATAFSLNRYKIYEVSLTNEEFNLVLVNKKETFGDQIKNKRRPRISFDNLMKQPYFSSKTQLVFNGDFINLKR